MQIRNKLTIYNLKAIIKKELGLHPQKLTIPNEEKELHEQQKLEETGIRDGDTILFT